MIDVSGIRIETAKDRIIDAVKKLELSILEEVDRICRKNHIEYSICGGTMLGAVRHGGFIPWDDDIDVNFTEEEYMRFIKACEKDLDGERFELLTHETNPNFNDFPAKILLKNTMCRSMSAKKADIPLTVCVDLFKLDKLPEDEEERLKVFHRLQVLRQLMFCISYDNITFLQDPADRNARNSFIMKHVSRETLYRKNRKLEEKINRKYSDSTYYLENWIYNTSNFFIHDVVEGGYEDVKFENITVRKFVRHHDYLVQHYGEDYMLMPPPEKRVSHHRFEEFDLGKYAEKFNLPDGYEKYMVVKQYLDDERLLKIKELCLEMLDEIDRICKENDITYYLSGDDLLFKAEDIEEMSILYRNPVSVFMDRKNLEKFMKVCPGELNKKYFLQTDETDPEYVFWYPKIRLNGTLLSDRTLYPADINEGIWVNIGMIVNTPENRKEAEEYYRELRQMNEDMKYRLLYSPERISTLKSSLEELRKTGKAEDVKKEEERISRIEEVQSIPIDTLKEKREALYRKYEDSKTDYMVEISTTMLKAVQMKKSDIGKGVRNTLLGHEYTFPENMKGIASSVIHDIPERGRRYERLRKVKAEESEKYERSANHGTKKFIKGMNEKHRRFDLGSYEAENYTLSVFYFEGEKH